MSPRTDRPLRGINVIILSSGREVYIDDIETAAEAETILTEVASAIVEMEAQLAAVAAGGSLPDPDWPRRVNIALGRKRYQRPRIQRRLDEMRKAERSAQFPDGAVTRKAAMKAAFVEAARLLLKQEVYAEVWQHARELHPAAFGKGGVS